MRATFFFLSFAICYGDTKLPQAANRKVSFEKDVQPLLEQKCHSCHGETVQQSGLRLDLRQNALRGGDYGPVILPGDSAGSKLIRRVVNGDGGLQMPPTGALSDEEIGILRAWIDQGVEFRIQVKAEGPVQAVDPKLAALLSAVRLGDSKSVSKMIAAHPELVRAKDKAGNTPLHHAAGFGNVATMKVLLDRGADANAGNRRKSTPLLWSLYEGAKVRLLLAHGADVSAKTVDGRSAIYQAAVMGNTIPVLRLLIEKGADANAKTPTGMTPLMAASRGNLDAMRLLLDSGADVKARNAAGGTALMAAASTGRPEAVRMLLAKGADANVRTKKNESALADAATAGNEETVKLLLNAGATVNVQDIRGYSPLAYAAGSDAVPAGVVKLLLAKGADVNVRGDDETPAMLAAKRGNTEVARMLGVAAEEKTKTDAGGLAGSDGHEKSIAETVAPALALLSKQSDNFIRTGGCNSCHAQDLPSVAAAIARDHGLPAPKLIPQLPQTMHSLNAERLMDLTPVTVAGMGWEMFDFGSNGVPRDEYIEATVHYIKAMQGADGQWLAFESRRPPMSAGPFQAAALAIYSLKTYGSPLEKADTDRCIARAVTWLESTKPENTQDRAFHLMALGWANASQASIRSSAKMLAALQHADGGWSQMPSLGTDAYATGQALYALNAAGNMRVDDAVYAKGVKYLLHTQAGDGSWHVKSRSIWVQPYFDGGFPYATDQWISAAGTAWATMALSLTVEPMRLSGNRAPR